MAESLVPLSKRNLMFNVRDKLITLKLIPIDCPKTACLRLKRIEINENKQRTTVTASLSPPKDTDICRRNCAGLGNRSRYFVLIQHDNEEVQAEAVWNSQVRT